MDRANRRSPREVSQPSKRSHQARELEEKDERFTLSTSEKGQKPNVNTLEAFLAAGPFAKAAVATKCRLLVSKRVAAAATGASVVGSLTKKDRQILATAI